MMKILFPHLGITSASSTATKSNLMMPIPYPNYKMNGCLLMSWPATKPLAADSDYDKEEQQYRTCEQGRLETTYNMKRLPVKPIPMFVTLLTQFFKQGSEFRSQT